MNELITWRIMCRHLILGLIFVPALALLLRDKPRSAGPSNVDRARASAAQDVAGGRLCRR
jgi:hypothetical protein